MNVSAATEQAGKRHFSRKGVSLAWKVAAVLQRGHVSSKPPDKNSGSVG
jgi:hypothetical protein